MAKEKSAPAAKKPAGIIVRNILIGLLVVAFVGVGAFGLLSRTRFLMDKLTALEFGGEKISALEYKIYYKTNEMNFISQYGTTLQLYYGVDLSQPLETQPYGDGTWGDYLHSAAQAGIEEIYTLYLEALENGYTLADDDDPVYQGELAAYRATAEAYEMELDEYIKAVYGSAVHMEDLEHVARIRATATNYYNDCIENLGVTNADAQARYEENPADYDEVDYRYFSFPYETVTYTEPAEGEELAEGAPASQEEADAMTEANIAEAQALADTFVSRVTNENRFADLALEYADEDSKEKYEDADATLTKGGALSNASSSATLQWCAEEGREKGDMTTIDTGSSIAVVYFVDRYLPNVPTASARHILIRASEAAEDASEEEIAEAESLLAAAKEKIEAILAEYESGEQTEEAFARLAIQYSQDSGSVTTGGLIEDFAEGDMVTEFNDWVFDSARKPGDVEIVKTTYGYHLIYFVADGDPEWQVSARQAVESEKYSEYYDSLAGKYSMTAKDYGVSLAY